MMFCANAGVADVISSATAKHTRETIRPVDRESNDASSMGAPRGLEHCSFSAVACSDFAGLASDAGLARSYIPMDRMDMIVRIKNMTVGINRCLILA